MFAEFFGCDEFNRHFINIEKALAYIRNIVELEIYDLSHVSLYELRVEDGDVHKMQIMYMDIVLMRKALKETLNKECKHG